MEVGERLARIEGAIANMQGEIAGMRDILSRLVRVEERMAIYFEQEIAAREHIKRLHERVDDIDMRITTMRAPLIWLAGLASMITASLISLIAGQWLR